MTYDLATGLVTRPPDQHLRDRVALLADLGLGEPDDEFDAFADRLAEDAGESYAMVNLVTDHQHFVGLHNPAGGESTLVGRTMSLDEGYCPEVVARGHALPLPDVCASPRYAANRVFDLLHVRTYTGAPLLHTPSGLVIGALCVAGPEPQPFEKAQERLDLVKDRCREFMELVRRRRAHA
ncbi:GAF domain-containing protein [Streptomyces sp. NPDC059118]|uniref:GAF domain-containing protein n=1 Tax=unclassified Streptomyces TaxID=2593676 RepID=UPI00368D8AAC